MKNELHHVISGKKPVRHGAIIQTIARYLEDSAQASGSAEDEKHVKSEETTRLTQYATRNQLWVEDIDFSQYISEGAEQKVYLENGSHVIKLNDTIYYNSWKDYFHNLLLHNYFFSDTAYELLGFARENATLYAVVKQPFVTITGTTDLQQVKTFLIKNGFKNTRNNDYYHPQLGIILEDLHDENVLTQNGVLYFIDTVFYLTDSFWLR